jgi:hypothetical protein
VVLLSLALVAIIVGVYFGFTHKNSIVSNSSTSPDLSKLTMVQFKEIVENSSTRLLSASDVDIVISLKGTTSVYLQLKTNPSTGFSLIVDNSTINGVFT